MNTERLVREVLEDSVKDLTCPEPDIAQLVAAGRTIRRRRVGAVAGMAAAATLLLILAGLSFAWAGRSGQALKPVPANSSTTDSRPLKAGTQVLAKPADSISDFVRLMVTLPPGWSEGGGRLTKQQGQPGEVALSIWQIDGVYDDPCHWRDSPTSHVDLLNEDNFHAEFHLAPQQGLISRPKHGGLANQLGRNASMPKKVTLGGIPAMMLQLSVPPNLDLGTCDDGEMRSWTGRGQAANWNAHHAPGQVDTVYQVDVDRKPLVVDASHGPAATQADLGELRSILASLVVDQG